MVTRYLIARPTWFIEKLHMPCVLNNRHHRGQVWVLGNVVYDGAHGHAQHAVNEMDDAIWRHDVGLNDALAWRRNDLQVPKILTHWGLNKIGDILLSDHIIRCIILRKFISWFKKITNFIQNRVHQIISWVKINCICSKNSHFTETRVGSNK